MGSDPLEQARARLRALNETKARLLEQMEDDPVGEDMLGTPLQTLRREFLDLDPEIAEVKAEIRALARR